MNSNEALNQLTRDVKGSELSFSTHAHVALQVRMALEDPEIHLESAARVVQTEPLLAARVVALANSVVFNRNGNKISDVRSAVTRVGLNLIRALSTALIMRQITTTASPTHQALASRLWEHSSHVAALCYVLARRVSRLNPDQALFAGIVHEVGGFYLISRADDYPGLLDDDMAASWKSGGQQLIGDSVLQALAVPEDIATAVRGLWQGNVALPPKSLADTLYLANSLTPITNPLPGAEVDMDRDEMLALCAQAMPQGSLTEILNESTDELETITASLCF